MQREPRQHDKAYLAWLRQQPCAICRDNTATEAAHLRVGSIEHGKKPAGLQEKSSDRWAVPLCHRHHSESHARGNEREWWASYGIDPFALSIHCHLQFRSTR